MKLAEMTVETMAEMLALMKVVTMVTQKAASMVD